MENTKNIIGVCFLGGIILLFVVGGYFLMDYMTHENHTGTTVVNDDNDMRIDSTKDYVYYENSEEIIDEIYKEDAVLNFKGLENINAELHQELNEISNTKAYYTNQELPEGTTCDNNLYSFTYREYSDNTFNDYVSLVVNTYDYTCGVGSKIKSIKSYVVNKKTGELLTNQELLDSFGVSEDTIYESVQKRLNNTQVLDGEEQVINISETLNNLKSSDYGVNKALSVSKNGKLMLNFIVISNKINYNDSIEI